MEPTNGKQPQQEMLTIGPTDKSVIIILDPIAKTVKTIAPNVTDHFEAIEMILAAFGAVLAQMKIDRDKNASNLVTLPPGSRLRG